MQSKLVSYAGKFSRVELFGRQKQFPAQILGCATTSGRTADPATHAVDPDVRTNSTFLFFFCKSSLELNTTHEHFNLLTFRKFLNHFSNF